MYERLTISIYIDWRLLNNFQATLGNLRELKLGLDNFDTMEIANFSAALTRAFDLLEIYRNNSGGANCNQVWSIN